MARKLNTRLLERESAKQNLRENLQGFSAVEQRDILADALKATQSTGALAAGSGILAQPWDPKEVAARRALLENQLGAKHKEIARFDNELEALEAYEAFQKNLDAYEESEGKVANLRKERERLAGKLADLWKTVDLPLMPRSFGDYLKSLIVCAEFKARMVDVVAHDVISGFLKNYHLTSTIIDFSVAWRETAFARVAVGHKLAAALMLTDPKDLEVKAPWDTWVLEIPEGFYPFEISPSKVKEGLETGLMNVDLMGEPRGDERTGQVRAILCSGTTPKRLLIEMFGSYVCLNVVKDAPPTKKKHTTQLALESYVKGVCLAFHDRKHVKESTWARGFSQRSSSEPTKARHYLLSTPIKVDFRRAVRDMLAGRKHNGVFTAQWIVRGHWRNQACGPGMKNHREQWIKPYWKGPEEARILLRGYELE